MSLPAPAESPAPTACEAAISSLRQLLGDRLSTATSVRERHGKDASYHPSIIGDLLLPKRGGCSADGDPEGRRRMW